MFGSYFKIALRALSKNKIFSLINLLGLAIGMACFILIISQCCRKRIGKSGAMTDFAKFILHPHNTVNILWVFMVSIKTGLKSDNQENSKCTNDTQSKPGNVNQGVCFIF